MKAMMRLVCSVVYTVDRLPTCRRTSAYNYSAVVMIVHFPASWSQVRSKQGRRRVRLKNESDRKHQPLTLVRGRWIWFICVCVYWGWCKSRRHEGE